MAIQRSLFLIVLTSVVLTLALPSHAEDAPVAKQAEKPRVLVTISKEITLITEPLRPDGYPNYLVAINQHASQGVTSENNAAVLFWQAMGPARLQPEDREEFYKKLGMKPLPDKGEYFTSIRLFVEKLAASNAGSGLPAQAIDVEQAEVQSITATDRPWSAKEFPALALWLDENEVPLKQIAQATHRSRYYEPMVSGGGTNWLTAFAPSPGLSAMREIMRALVARAMFRINEDRYDLASEDLLTCHRLARLYSQGPMTLDKLVAYALESMACSADQQLLLHARMSRAQIAKMRADLAKLPPISKFSDVFEVGERYCYLDCVTVFARDGMKSIGAFCGDNPDILQVTILAMQFALTNWDQVMRSGNADCDRIVACFKLPTHAKRAAAAIAVRDQPDTSQLDSLPRLLDWLRQPREMISKNTSHKLSGMLLRGMVPTEINCEDKATIQFELVQISFALAAYEADNGAYPETLDALSPKYMAAVPKDIFNDAELHYARRGSGYLLYSVGPDGVDSGAIGFDDPKADRSDDIFIYIPAAPGKAK